MNKRTFQVLNKTVQLSLEDMALLPEDFDDFCCSDRAPDVMFLSDGEAQGKSCYGIRYLSDQGEKIKNVFFSQKDRGQMLYSFADDYSQLRLQLDGNCTKEILSELLMVGFYSYASLRETLLLHASAIRYQERAVVFTAASGVGKTTQAELWHQYRDCAILNGDKIFLQKESDRLVAWGSPWKGSSPYAENAGAELAAIIVLEQGEENQIRKLSGMEMFRNLLPHIFFPNWDPRCERGVLDLLDEVLGRVEVYLLCCRPDEDAVALVEKTLF